ncbi:hypothetical protein AVEN_202786-1, partial [Araneus ventricosus]
SFYEVCNMSLAFLVNLGLWCIGFYSRDLLKNLYEIIDCQLLLCESIVAISITDITIINFQMRLARLTTFHERLEQFLMLFSDYL